MNWDSIVERLREIVKAAPHVADDVRRLWDDLSGHPDVTDQHTAQVVEIVDEAKQGMGGTEESQV